MKLKTYLSLIVVFLSTFTAIAQHYDFVPSHLILLGEEQMKTTQIMITPDVYLFSERGEILPMSSMSLMANTEYKPLFYADNQGALKAVVFQKKNNHPIVIQKSAEAQYTKGERAIDFITTDINGNTIKLSDLKGKVVVLNFWFTKCGPCKVELPQLNELTEEFSDDEVTFLAITFDKKELVEQFIETLPFNYNLVADANDVITMYGVQSYPTSIVINKQGEVILKELGFRTNIKSVLSAAINSVL